ncbi:MAG: hypothetical protein HY360_03805 [Verrucomicrobia bacterium]|nr:hypothetical protein [Verrucomicrobiota bacterium]
MNIDYRGEDFFTAPGSYFHFTEPFRQLFPGLAALHYSYNICPITISDCILTVGLHMTRERRGLWKTDKRNAVRSHPHLFEKVCFMDQIAITTRAVFAGPQAVVAQIEIRNGEEREIRFQPRLMGGWFQSGKAAFAANRLAIQHHTPAFKTWRTIVLAPSFRVATAKAPLTTVNVHPDWPQLEGSRYGPQNMYELLGEEVRLAAGTTHRFEVVLWLGLGRCRAPRRFRGMRFAAAERRARREHERCAKRLAFTCADRAVEDRCAYAQYWMQTNLIAASEQLGCDVMIAHKKLSAIWFWDTCFHAVGWAALDRAISENHLRILAKSQRRDGLIAQVISHKRSIVQPQPPIYLLVAFEVFRLHRNDRIMRAIMPVAERYHDWWERHRFSSKFGLYFYKDAFDSGWDHSVRYDVGHGWLAPDLNAMMYRNFEVQEFFYRRWGQTKKAIAIAAKRVRLGAAICERLWNRRIGFFCDADAQTGRLFDTKTPAGFLPLLVNGVTAEQKRVLLKHLFNPREFWLPHPLPSVSADNPKFIPWEYSYPRGTTWVSFGNWLPYLALRRAGLDAAAHAVALRTIRTICHCPDKSIYEHYNSLTGAGHGCAMMGWSITTLVDLIRREYGVDFTDDGNWIFTSPATPDDYQFETTLRGCRIRLHRKHGRTQVTVNNRRVATLERGTRIVMTPGFDEKAVISLQTKEEFNTL